MSFQDRRNRSWTSRLLAALFPPFMSDSSEEAPPELPQIRFNCSGYYSGGGTSVGDWYLWITDDTYSDHYTMCSLDRIDYCKCTHGAKHEFLLFYFRYSTSSAEAVVYVDRNVKLGDDSRQLSEVVSPSPSSKEPVTSDRALLLGSPDDAVRFLRDIAGRYKKLCTLTFFPPSAPSVIQIAAILYLTHQQVPANNLYENQCFQYTDSVWMSVKRIFPENEESCRYRNARDRYCGIGRSGLSSMTVEAICAAYLPEWQEMSNNLKLAQGTVCSPRAIAWFLQVREKAQQEWFAEATRAADERVRRLQQAADEQAQVLQQAVSELLRTLQRAADEQAQIRLGQLRKVQAEIEQLRAKIATL